MSASTTTLQLKLGGLVAVHAARAAQMALGAVPQILSATVTMAGATIDVARPYELATLTAAVSEALESVGLVLLDARIMQDRVLPLA